MKFMRLIVVSVAVLVLSACNGSSPADDDDASPDASTSAAPDATATQTPEPTPTGPECSDVWLKGETLAVDYAGCLIDGEFGPQDDVPCLDDTTLVVFDDAYYAVTGGAIKKPDIAPLQDTEEFGAAYAACTGE